MESVSTKLSAWLVASIQGFVSRPGDVQVEAKEDEMGLFFIVRVHADDRGKVIGKKGTHAQALRTLLRCAGGLNYVRASMKVEVPGNQYEPNRAEE